VRKVQDPGGIGEERGTRGSAFWSEGHTYHDTWPEPKCKVQNSLGHPENRGIPSNWNGDIFHEKGGGKKVKRKNFVEIS